MPKYFHFEGHRAVHWEKCMGVRQVVYVGGLHRHPLPDWRTDKKCTLCNSTRKLRDCLKCRDVALKR